MSVQTIVCLLCLAGQSLLAAESLRLTPTVRLVQQVRESVVAVFSQDTNGAYAGGSGSIIDSTGVILSNDHVVGDRPGWVLLPEGGVLPYRTLGRLPEKDLALIKVNPDRPLKRIRLGRSHDLMSGEPILVEGNPGGRGIVFSSGIVSSPAVMINAPDALTMSAFRGDVRDRFVQFDAACNPGNSGGPLVGAEGKQIGVVARKSGTEQSISFAIPVDRVRQFFTAIIEPEVAKGYWLGLKVDLLADRAVVTEVAEESPAAQAGLRKGDVVLSVEGKPLETGVDWVLACIDGKPGKRFGVVYERGARRTEAALTATDYPLAPVAVAEGKQPGLRYQLYHCQVTNLVGLAELRPAASGVSPVLQTEELAGGRQNNYALIFEGFLRVPETGQHRLLLGSDDGSKLYLDGRLLVENDGLHPWQVVGCMARLAAGLHSVRVEYFQATCNALLKLYLQSGDHAPREVGAELLWHD